MATGDDAIAAGMPVMTGNEQANTLDTEINLTRDLIAQRTNDVTPVVKGGTGATNAAGARSNLGIPAISAPGVATENGLAVFGPNKRLQVQDPSLPSDAATKFYVDQRDAATAASVDLSSRVAKTGDVMSGGLTIHSVLVLPSAFAATSSYTVAYIDGDGRVARGASSERYKKFINDIDPLSLGHLFPPLKRWQMRSGDGVWRYGYTAEQLAADPVTEPFVVYQRHIEDDGTAPHLERDDHGNPIPESIDFIGLLLAQVAQLNQRLAELEERT
jgi:hypothetical protein